MKITLKTLGLVAAMSTLTHADENLWMYAKGTDTRPKGTWEFKLSNISRIGKGEGSYMFNDFRPEIEYGVTDRFTVYGELFGFQHRYSGFDSVNADGDSTHDPIEGSKSSAKFGGFELGFKYNVLSPYKDALGLSFGLGYEQRYIYRLDGADINQGALVPQIYLQKNYLDNQLTLAFAGKMEFERRKARPADGVLEEEIAYDLAAGIAYRFKPKWTAGLELRWQSDYLEPAVDGVYGEPDKRSDFSSLGDLRHGEQFQYGLYAGPSIHYAEEGWWVTGSVLFLVNSGGDTSRNVALQEYGEAYDEHEKMHIGVTVGFEF